MSEDPFTTPGQEAPETTIRRTKDGRPYVYDLEKGRERPFTRVTTFIDCIEDKTALAKWGERMVLLGVKRSAEVGSRVMQAPEVPTVSTWPTHEEVQARNQALQGQKEWLQACANDAKEAAGWKQAADLGTQLHLLTEYADQGRDLPSDTSPVMREDVDAYLQALERHGLTPMEEEVFVVNDEVGAAGTFDRLFRWERPDGQVWNVIGDLKTGRIDYGHGKLAMQLALYANSSRYDPTRPEWREALPVSRNVGLIIHLPVGSAECRVHVVDLQAGWRGVQLAKAVREYRRESARGMLYDLALEGDLMDRVGGLDS